VNNGCRDPCWGAGKSPKGGKIHETARQNATPYPLSGYDQKTEEMGSVCPSLRGKGAEKGCKG